MSTNEQMTNALLAKIAELEQRATRAEAELAALKKTCEATVYVDMAVRCSKAENDNAALRAALEQIFVWWDAKDGHLTTHFPTAVCRKMESFRAALAGTTKGTT